MLINSQEIMKAIDERERCDERCVGGGGGGGGEGKGVGRNWKWGGRGNIATFLVSSNP